MLMLDIVTSLIPVVGLAVSTAVRMWQRSHASTIVIPEEALERLGNAPEVTLSPELIRRLEHGTGSDVVTDVEEGASAVPELTPAREGVGTRPSRWTRETITFGAVLLFSVGGFVWSLVVLSTHASSEAKYGATATLGWIFGYWFRPDILIHKASRTER
jgi:hypothetical protein